MPLCSRAFADGSDKVLSKLRTAIDEIVADLEGGSLWIELKSWLNDCPDDVEFRQIGDVVLKIKNIRWSENKESEFKYIDLTSVDRTTHLIVGTSTINAETAPSRAQQIVQKGDVIFGTPRPMLQRYAIIQKEYDGQIWSTGFCVLCPDNNIVLTNFL